MNVLYFHQHFSTPQGRAITRSYEMAKALLAAGHKVTIVCGSYDVANTGLSGPFRKGRREGLVEGIRVIEFDLPYGNAQNFFLRTLIFLKFALGSVNLALTEQYDVLFATSTPLTVALPGIAARWLRNKPFVFEVRDLWPELPKAMGVITNPVVLYLMGVLEWMAYHSATRVIGLSGGMADGIVRRGIPAHRVTVVPNGCDLDLFTPAGEKLSAPGVGPNDLVAVFAGTHGVANGLDSVIDAAAELHRRGLSDIRLLLIGEGKLKPGLVDRARLEAPDTVIFLDGMPKTRLTAYLRGANLGLQILQNVPAFYQGTSPNKFFDYISSGLPVLTNYPGWVAEMITENRCGFVISPDDPIAFADALEEAARVKAALPDMGRRARELAERDFSRARQSAKFIAWLEGAMRARA